MEARCHTISNRMKVQPRTAKLIIAGVFLLILASLVFAQQAFDLELFNPTDPEGIVVSSALSALVFLVLLIFGFVLLRTVVKVWVERKQQKPGSKFKTSLLVWLVTLTLIPAICVFAYSFGLLNRNISKMFSLPVDEIFKATDENKQQWQTEHEGWARSILMHLASQSGSASRPRIAAKSCSISNALMVIDPSGHVDKIAAAKEISTDSIPRDVLGRYRHQQRSLSGYEIRLAWRHSNPEPRRPENTCCRVSSASRNRQNQRNNFRPDRQL